MNDLERAVVYATKMHSGQTDKAGKPYIEHPLRVMGEMDYPTEKVVAVLHDVVEDTDATIDDIEELFGVTVADNVSALTHREGEYMGYIDAIAVYPTARKVKMGELVDNMDLSRLDEIEQEDLERRNRYEQAYYMLQSVHAVL